MKEVDLSEPVRLWLESRGYEPYAEVQFLYKTPDWLGLHKEDGTGIAVEMKRSLTRGVIRQAFTLNLACESVFVAVGTKPRKAGIEQCRRHGIGVLSVVDGKAQVIMESVRQNNFPVTTWKKKLIERLRLYEPGGEAGNPTLAESGPAQDCYKRVQEYRALYPKATWQEIFNTVANHYANPRSLAGSMTKAVERRNWWGIRRKTSERVKEEKQCRN